MNGRVQRKRTTSTRVVKKRLELITAIHFVFKRKKKKITHNKHNIGR